MPKSELLVKSFGIVKNIVNFVNMNEIRKDLYTQAEYAKTIGVSRQRVNKMVKDGLLKLVEVKGTVLIKVE